MLILWGARTCAFGSKNCSHYSKRVISSLSDHKVIVYRCREQRVFRSLNITLWSFEPDLRNFWQNNALSRRVHIEINEYWIEYGR